MNEVTNENIKYDKNSIITRLKSKLESHYIDSEKLFQILFENKAYLSSSYLIGPVCGSNFGKENLDIFVFYNDTNEKLENQIHDCIYKNMLYPRKFYTEFCKYPLHFHHSFGIKSKSYMRLTYHQKIDEIKNKIDYINIKYIDKNCYSNMKSYVNTLNLSIFSNYYDGVELYIRDLTSIINKCFVFNMNDNNNDNINIDNININNKYNGFCFSDENLEIIIKYLKRDFNININYSNDIYGVYNVLSKFKSIQNKKVLLLINECYNESVSIIEINELINKLAFDTEIILVYFHSEPEEQVYPKILDLGKINFPPLLKEVRFLNASRYIYEFDYESEPKLPYGCELYIDNEKIQ